MKRVQLNEQLADRLEKAFPGRSLTDRVSRSVSGYLMVRKAALVSLKGKFGRNELIGLLDAFNGHLFAEIQYEAKFMLRAEMEDAQTLEGNADRHDYDGPGLLARIDQLSEGEACTLMDLLEGFWQQTDPVMDDFVTLLT